MDVQEVGRGSEELGGRSQSVRITAPDSRSLRVAFDARMLYYRRAGGIGQYSISLLKALAAIPEVGRGSRIYTLQMRGDADPVVRDRRFRRVAMWTPPHHRLEQPSLSVEMLKVRPRPQIIHSPDFVPPRFRLFPAVANVQDLAFLKFPETTLLTDESKRYYGQVYRAARDAQALIALSHSARDDIVSLLSVSPRKVEVIPAAAGEEFHPPENVEHAQREAARVFGLPTAQEGGYVLFVSTIEPRKNLPVLFEAYRLLLDRGRVSPVPVLALAGREGWLYEQVYERMDALRLRPHVRLLGEVSSEKLVGLYQGARAFALPSIYEGFGMPALEALACGAPVLSSTGGSLPEVVGDAGVLLDPHDAQGWADALEQVLGDPDEEGRLRKMGPLRAARFSWRTAASQTWALYKRVIAGTGT